ncbi:uncharacterized protein [Henckelia pumila]
MHQQAIELVRCLCKALESFPSSEASTIYEKALFLAVHNDIFEVVEVILEMFPTAINAIDTKTEATIFHVAARERSETVFNLLQMKEGKHFLYNYVDSSGNNYMHMCGEQAPTHKLNLVSGAALQMQRELQWFKEMENFVTPSRRTMQNNEGKTPKMLFTEKHQELKSQGEKWMKDTATSCSIAAALIATVVFAAAFTVPGGFSNNGIPVFVKRKLFITFALSDSVSLFSSATSLLMFLSILTSRYAEEDFLYLLPTRLCIGLLTLFTSIIFMVVAFSITIYITVQENSNLFLIPIVILACFPVASFMLLQFPLLIDAVYSTYGPGFKRSIQSIFYKLNGKSYLEWAQSIKFVTGKKGRPGYLMGLKFENSMVSRGLLTQWNLQLGGVFIPTHAKEVWEAVREIYSDLESSSQIFELKNRL